jgi:K+-transporting ATPase ATPase C chain
MLADTFKDFRTAIIALLAFTMLTGLAYPLAITGIAQGVFNRQANGSLIERDGKAVGSALIGQPFSDPKYFWSRGSATGPMPYNAGASSGSNQGPLNPALADAVKGRIEALQKADPDNKSTRSDEWRRRAGSRPRKCARSSPSTPKAGSSASSASRG